MTNLSQLCLSFYREQSGIAMVYTALIMVPILAVAGFAIDSSYVTYLKTRLQNTADAAALAGASIAPSRVAQLTNEELYNIIANSQTYATTNMPNHLFGEVLSSTDIQVGHWSDEQQFSLDLTNTDINAVKVTTSLSAAKTNAASLNLLRLLGHQQMDLQATAIAYIQAKDTLQCLDNGFVALGKLSTNGNNVMTGSSACLYGHEGVKMASNSCFGEDPNASKGVFFGMPDPQAAYGSGGFQFANHNVIASTEDCQNGLLVGEDVETGVYEVDISGAMANPAEFIFDLSVPAGDPLHSQAIVDLIAQYTSNPGDFPDAVGAPVHYSSNTQFNDLSNQLIFVDGDVTFSSGASIDNSYIFATGDVFLPANGHLGSALQCDEISSPDDLNQVLVMAAGSVKFAANPQFYATQIVAGEDINFTANGGAAGGISLIAGGDIKLTSNWNISSCPDNNHWLEFDQQQDRRLSGRATLVW